MKESRHITLRVLTFNMFLLLNLVLNIFAVEGFSLGLVSSKKHLDKSSVMQNIEKILNYVWEHSWDTKDGGFFKEILGDTIYNDKKDLYTHVQGVLAYAYMYYYTKNTTYLQSADNIINIIENKMRDSNGSYWFLWNREYSEYYTPNGLYHKKGANTIIFLLSYLDSLLLLYNASQDTKYLAKAIELWDYIYKLTWDNAFPGINYIADIWIEGKESLSQANFAYLSYRLYLITDNSTYRNVSLTLLYALEKLWNNGFHSFYYTDYSVYNDMRPLWDSLIPLIGYYVGYLLTTNQTYLERINTLLYQENKYFWDSAYLGYFKVLTHDFKVFLDEKVIWAQTYVLQMYANIMRLNFQQYLSEHLKESPLEDHISQLVSILYSKLIEYTFLPKFDRYWNPTENIGYVSHTFSTIVAIIPFIDLIKEINYTEEQNIPQFPQYIFLLLIVIALIIVTLAVNELLDKGEDLVKAYS